MLKTLPIVAVATGLTFLAAGCGRDTSSPSKMLIGHWVATSRIKGEQTDYCFRKDGTVISRNRIQDTIRKKPYTIEFESPKNRTIEVVIGELASIGYADRIVFSPDSRAAKVYAGGRFGEVIEKSNKAVIQAYHLAGENPPTLADSILQDWQYKSNDVQACG